MIQNQNEITITDDESKMCKLDDINNKIITIIGSHAKEDLISIINRKCNDIKNNGFTLWFFKKNKYCNELSINNNYNIYFCFPKITGSSKPTIMNKIVDEYSFDNITWESINKLNISPVTGNIVKNSICLMIKNISDASSNKEINVGIYNNVLNMPMKLNQFFSTQIGIYNDDGGFVNPNIRKIAFIGELYQNGFCYVR
jgi:hypothetical protein